MSSEFARGKDSRVTYRAQCEGRKVQRATRRRRAVLFGGTANSWARVVKRFGGTTPTIDRSLTFTVQSHGRVVWKPEPR